MEIHERLKKYRIARGLKQIDVANAMQISKSTYSSYESGRRLPDATKIGKLAEILGVTSDALLGTEHLTDNIYEQLEQRKILTPIDDVSEPRRLPLLGTIACGDPIEAIEETGEFIDLNSAVKGDFALRCKGNSMVNARIYDGDIVVCKKQDTVENGEIAVVLIDNEVTLKRFYWFEDAKVAILRPENPDYEEIHITANDFVDVRVLGKALTTIRHVK